MSRINRAIELLEQDQPIYYMGNHTGHVLTYEQGVEDAGTWADYINVGMEHGAFDMAGLDAYMKGLVDGGADAQWASDAGGYSRGAGRGGVGGNRAF